MNLTEIDHQLHQIAARRVPNPALVAALDQRQALTARRDRARQDLAAAQAALAERELAAQDQILAGGTPDEPALKRAQDLIHRLELTLRVTTGALRTCEAECAQLTASVTARTEADLRGVVDALVDEFDRRLTAAMDIEQRLATVHRIASDQLGPFNSLVQGYCLNLRTTVLHWRKRVKRLLTARKVA